MRLNPKLVYASLFIGVNLLTACSEKTNPAEANLTELQQGCMKLASFEDFVHDAQSMCSCLTSKMRTEFSEVEQHIVTAVMSGGLERMEAGEAHPSEVKLIMLHSDLNKAQSKALADRVSDEVAGCGG